MRLRVLIAGLLLPLVLWLSLPLVTAGAQTAGRAASLQKKLQITQGKIGRKKGTERVLSSDIARYSSRINRLQTKIGGLQTRQQRVQADLDAKQRRLRRTQSDLRFERARSVRLRVRLAEARVVLSRRLRELYQADKPDLVTVILNSSGFADLLERGEFIKRIADSDKVIVKIVRNAKADAATNSKRLAVLEKTRARLTSIVEVRRDEIAQVKQGLIDTRVGYDTTRDGKQRALSNVRAERHDLQEDLESIKKEQAAIEAKLQQSSGTYVAAGPIRGNGAFIWPVNGPITGVVRRGSAPATCTPASTSPPRKGTPIRAAASGRVVLLGWTGGYGNYTCIQHNAALSVLLRASVALRDVDGCERHQGPGHRLRRQHGPFVRCAPAFRGARERHPRQPDELPVALRH